MDILYILKGLIIAVVEGITEFLPISSTGHLIIAGHFINFGNGEFEKMYMVVIQLGAILAIVYLYWDKLFGVLKSLLKGEKYGLRFALAIIIGIIPAMIFGFALENFIDNNLFSVPTVIIGLIVGAVMMIIFEDKYRGKSNTTGVERIKPMQAIKVGLFQVMSLWPGMSRSASTIMGGWHQGLSPEVAAEYSFFLAIPIMVGASGLKFVKYAAKGGLKAMTLSQGITLVIGFIVAFFVAMVVVKAFMNFIKKKPMKVFAYYRFALAALLIVMVLIFKI
ncbi:MAG: undecaprenyl-diphosphate phosphatase [Clostridiaceae bacterium]